MGVILGLPGGEKGQIFIHILLVMEFLKYGDCPLELQNLGRAKLMLELSPCTFIEKQSLRSENTDMPGTDSLQHQNKLYFQSQ